MKFAFSLHDYLRLDFIKEPIVKKNGGTLQEEKWRSYVLQMQLRVIDIYVLKFISLSLIFKDG